MNYKKKYNKIMGEFIKKSFPELKKRKIKVIEYYRVFPGESTTIRLNSFHILFINRKCRKRKNLALRGQLAHELCHMCLDYKDKGIFSSSFHFIRKTISAALDTKFSREIEIKVDRETIKRGYRKERLALAIEYEKTYSKDYLKDKLYSRGYLSPEQIKKQRA